MNSIESLLWRHSTNLATAQGTKDVSQCFTEEKKESGDRYFGEQFERVGKIILGTAKKTSSFVKFTVTGEKEAAGGDGQT